MNTTINFKQTDLTPLKKLAKDSPKAFQKGLEAGALQLLTWMNTGSPNESRKPPIDWGILRGSSSVFVGGKLVGEGKSKIRSGSDEQPTPLTSYSAANTTISVFYNTDYAAKMHEWEGGWGPGTERDGDAGNKWIEMHLKADKDLLMAVIGLEVKRDLKL